MEALHIEESQLLHQAVSKLSDNHHENENALLINSQKKNIRTELVSSFDCVNGSLSHIDNDVPINCECCNDFPPISSLKQISTPLIDKIETDDAEPQPNNNHKHFYANVVVNRSNDISDLDTDEEDFQLKSKNDSGQGSSVETSSIKSTLQDLQNSELSNSKPSIENNEINNILNDISLNGPEIPQLKKKNSLLHNSPDTDHKIIDTSFTDIPLDTPSPGKFNTFTPATSAFDQIDLGPLKPPTITDDQPKANFLKNQQPRSWKIFGKVAVPVAKVPSPKVSPRTQHRNKLETVGSSTTALILENRPSNLPPKSEKEEQRHREEYEEMIAAAKRKELKDHLNEKKKLKQLRKIEDQLSNSVKTWKEDIIPNWEACYNSRKVRDLWWLGIPPSVRGLVWRLAVGNALYLTPELFRIFQSNAKEKMAQQKNMKDLPPTLHDSESSLVVCKENVLGLIALDVQRTFPSLCIFQKGGPYHDSLKYLLAAYTCHRPDVGYVQGMSFVAAMLLLNMDLTDAFIAFANILNRSCQMAFFMVDQPMMDAYFRTFDVLVEENLPRLHHHFRSECLSHDIYLIDWIFTIYSKSLPLDTACRVWDLFLRDGEEFLFRTALGILSMHQDALLEMEFFRLASNLTKLSTSLTADELFHHIEKINIPKQKFQQTLAYFKSQIKVNKNVHPP